MIVRKEDHWGHLDGGGGNHMKGINQLLETWGGCLLGYKHYLFLPNCRNGS